MGRGSDLPAGGAHGLFPCDAAGLFFKVPELRLGPGQRIMDALPRDAEILGDLTEGQILIILEVEAGALLLRQKLTVVIVEQRHRQRVVLHAECLLSGVWPLQLRYHTGFCPVCQVKNLSDAETDKKFYLHFEHIMLTWGIHI